MSEDVWMTVKQVADHMQVNEKTVRHWIDEGLPAFPVGGRGYRIAKADLDIFIKKRQEELRQRKQEGEK